MNSPFVPIAMFGIIPVALLLVNWLRPLRGIVATFVLGWLLLPNAAYKVSMLPPYTKSAAVSLAALIAMVVFDSGRIARVKPRLADIPVLLWCLSPSISSMDNGLGPQDAIAVFLDQALTWGIPYLFGRMYFSDPDAFNVLTRGLVLGGLLYAPLCIYEMRMAPVLHSSIYGYHQHQFIQSVREGGYRPTVFMQHGLAVGFFVSITAMVAIWLWRRRAAARFLMMPVAWVALGLAAIGLLCRSTGATALFFLGLAVLYAASKLRSKLPLYALLLAAPLYMSVRATGLWDGEELLTAASMISADRADSLQCRITSENILGAHALTRPLFGWGGWGRSYTDGGTDENVIADGFWIIAFGKYGVCGLFAVTSTLLLPVFLVIFRTPAALLFSARGAPALAFGVLVNLFVVDSLFNAMLNPIFVLAAGGLVGMGKVTMPPMTRRLVRRPPAAGRGARPPALRGPREAPRALEVPAARTPAPAAVAEPPPAAEGGGAAPA